MARPWMLAVTYSSAALAVACAAEPKQRSGQVGVYRDAGAIAGSSGAAGNVIDMAGAGAEMATAKRASVESSALGVRVQDRQKLTIEVITIACEGDCAAVEAVAHGGNPPYGYAWEDGSRDPKRHVCLDASKKLTITVTDTSLDAAEFGYKAQKANAEVMVNVMGCEPPPHKFCIENPSFEGTPGLGLQAPSLVECNPSADIGPVPPLVTTPPSDGATYLGIGTLGVSPTPLENGESVGTEFCDPLEPGQSVSFTVDVAVDSAFFAPVPARLMLWAGESSCGVDELLWESPMLTTFNMWQTFCVTIKPSKGFKYLRLVPATTRPAISYMVVDNFRPKDGCP